MYELIIWENDGRITKMIVDDAMLDDQICYLESDGACKDWAVSSL